MTIRALPPCANVSMLTTGCREVTDVQAALEVCAALSS